MKAAELTGKYVVCTECGKEFPYDWERMKVTNQKTYRRDEAKKERAKAQEAEMAVA